MVGPQKKSPTQPTSLMMQLYFFHIRLKKQCNSKRPNATHAYILFLSHYIREGFKSFAHNNTNFVLWISSCSTLVFAWIIKFIRFSKIASFQTLNLTQLAISEGTNPKHGHPWNPCQYRNLHSSMLILTYSNNWNSSGARLLILGIFSGQNRLIPMCMLMDIVKNYNFY